MLSLCIIVKNEAGNLKKYLSNMAGFFDEIIIVDTGSSDETLMVARELTRNVFSFEWRDDFSKAKNYAISKAKGEWILFLDADESITKEDIKKIKEAINKESIDAFRVNVINYLSRMVQGSKINRGLPFNHPYFISFKLARLFRNKKEYRYDYRVHELIEESIEKNKGVIKELDVCIHHFGTLNLENKKNDYYEFLVLRQLKELPDDKRALYYAGQVYLNKKEYNNTIELFEKITSIDPSYKNIHAKIGQLYFLMNDLSRAIDNYKKGIDLVNDVNQKAQLANHLALIYHKNNQNNLAKELLKDFIRNNEVDERIKRMLEMNFIKL